MPRKILNLLRRKKKESKTPLTDECLRNRPKRNLIWRPEQKKRLMKVLGEKLKNKNFFERLPNVAGRTMARFDFGGIPVLIKYTPSETHGRDYEGIEKIFKEYNKTLKGGEIKAKRSVLRLPKAYGRIGDYVIMEYMDWLKDHDLFDNRKLEHQLLLANDEAINNIISVAKSMKLHIQGMPKAGDIVLWGNTNPKNPSKGKWIFYMLYDYVENSGQLEKSRMAKEEQWWRFWESN